MSLPFVPLDIGSFTSARSDPMASAQFGAESGAYSLKSTPPTPIAAADDGNAIEYEMPQTIGSRRSTNSVYGAAVADAAATTDAASESCNVVAAGTFLGCTWDAVKGTFTDFSKWSTGSGTNETTQASDTGRRVLNIFTTNRRYIYLLALVLAIAILRRLLSF